MRTRHFLAVAITIALAACGGGGGGSAIPSGSPTNAPGGGTQLPFAGSVGTMTAQAQVSTAFALVKSKMRRLSSLRDTKGYTIASVEVDGTLYPSYASATVITNKQILTPVSNAISISMTFSNVPAVNNAWMILDLKATATDGSQFDMGQLAAVVNIVANQTGSITLGQASSDIFEVFDSLLTASVLSSADLADANLASTLASAVAATGVTPDPATGIYNSAQLTSILSTVARQYDRNLKITVTGMSASDLSNANWVAESDYTSTAEANLFRNKFTFNQVPLAAQASVPFNVQYSPCSIGTVPQTGPSNPVPPQTAFVCINSSNLGGGSSYLFSHIYGGAVMVGATTTSTPFISGWTKVAAIPAGGTTNVTIAAAPSQQNVAVTDPQNFAQCCSDYLVSTMPGAVSSYFPFANNNYNVRAALPNPFDATHNIIAINTFSYYNQPASKVIVCPLAPESNYSLDNACPALSTLGPTWNVQRPFDDPSYAGYQAYWNWHAGAGASTLSSGFYCGGPNGYVVTTNGAMTGSITTTTPTYIGNFTGTSVIRMRHNDGPYTADGCNGTNAGGLSAAMVWSVSVTDTGNTVYQGTTNAPSPAQNDVAIRIPSITKSIAVKSITLTWTIPAGSTPPPYIGLHAIYSDLETGFAGGGGD